MILHQGYYYLLFDNRYPCKKKISRVFPDAFLIIREFYFTFIIGEQRIGIYLRLPQIILAIVTGLHRNHIMYYRPRRTLY